MAPLLTNEEPPVPFGTVGPPDWADGTVYLIGGGKSLAGFDFERLRGRGVAVGINQSMFDVEFVDVGVTIDPVFVGHFHSDLVRFASNRPLFVLLGNVWWQHSVVLPNAIYLRNEDVKRGGTSGFAALQIALKKNAKHIVLLGFDYIPGHYHSAYPWKHHDKGNDASWPRWSKDFTVSADAEIINASERSLITCYPKVSLETIA
jgi:hypothetical protein